MESENNKFTLGVEKEIHDRKKVRPDFIIEEKAQGSLNNVVKARPVFVIEIKRINQIKFSHRFKQRSMTLEDDLPQLYEYLRLLCLVHHLPHLSGVLTNYQDWIFVRYSL